MYALHSRLHTRLQIYKISQPKPARVKEMAGSNKLSEANRKELRRARNVEAAPHRLIIFVLAVFWTRVIIREMLSVLHLPDILPSFLISSLSFANFRYWKAWLHKNYIELFSSFVFAISFFITQYLCATCFYLTQRPVSLLHPNPRFKALLQVTPHSHGLVDPLFFIQ